MSTRWAQGRPEHTGPGRRWRSWPGWPGRPWPPPPRPPRAAAARPTLGRPDPVGHPGRSPGSRWPSPSVPTPDRPADLHVGVTVYNRIDNRSEFEQAAGAAPTRGSWPGRRRSPWPTRRPARVAVTCVTVLPDARRGPPPTPGPRGGLPGRAPPWCWAASRAPAPATTSTPSRWRCCAPAHATPVARFTTFLTYEEPGVAAAGTGGRCGWPGSSRWRHRPRRRRRGRAEALVDQLAARPTAPRRPPWTSARPRRPPGPGARGPAAAPSRTGRADHGRRGPTSCSSPPYVPSRRGALGRRRAGLGDPRPGGPGGRGVLGRRAARRPGGPWLDGRPACGTDLADLTTGAARPGHPATGPQHTACSTPRRDHERPAPSPSPSPSPLAHGDHVTAAATDGELDARFGPARRPGPGRHPAAGRPGLHPLRERVPDRSPRAWSLVPPAGWHPSPAFVDTLLAGLAQQPDRQPGHPGPALRPGARAATTSRPPGTCSRARWPAPAASRPPRRRASWPTGPGWAPSPPR